MGLITEVLVSDLQTAMKLRFDIKICKKKFALNRYKFRMACMSAFSVLFFLFLPVEIITKVIQTVCYKFKNNKTLQIRLAV